MFPKILSGVKVLDFSRLLPGPLASGLLIKLGAEVNCILPPFADPHLGDYSPFDKLRAGKNFTTLDLKKPEGLERAQELLQRSQILLEGFRPGTMEKLGLGFDHAKKMQPEILYVSITGYQEGHPMHFKGAHDLNFLIDSGVYSLLFPDNLAEIPLLQLADVVGGFYAAFQILVEWIHLSQSKIARHLKVSMVEGLELLSAYLRDPKTLAMIPMLTGQAARYHIFTTRDARRIFVGAIEPKFYRNLQEALKVKISEDEPEPAAIDKIQKKFSEKTLEEWRDILKHADACISFIPDRLEVLKF